MDYGYKQPYMLHRSLMGADMRENRMNDSISRQAAIRWIKAECNPYGKPTLDYETSCRIMEHLDRMPSAEPEQYGRIFQEIIVEYPSISTYLEYKGKPYFSIKYTEDGQGYIGYGTYKPEVLSEYLKKYFIPSAEPERKTGKWIDYSYEGYVECPFCHSATNCDGNKDELHYCFSCGAELRGEQE